MQLQISLKGKIFSFDTSQGMDLSIPLTDTDASSKAFYIPQPRFEPYKAGSFVGSVAEGGSCNCENIYINPHCNGTHTECIGHIAKERITLNNQLKEFFFTAEVVTITPEKVGEDNIIQQHQIEAALKNKDVEAIIIRTLPNGDEKITQSYSGTNPTYMHHEATAYIRDLGIKHLLIDTPSVDREEDGGELLAHHAYWNYPDNPRMDATISEMIYVRNEVKDGMYLLNLLITALESDASPSKPILYALEEV